MNRVHINRMCETDLSLGTSKVIAEFDLDERETSQVSIEIVWTGLILAVSYINAAMQIVG